MKNFNQLFDLVKSVIPEVSFFNYNETLECYELCLSQIGVTYNQLLSLNDILTVICVCPQSNSKLVILCKEL